jgi:hypothetical protein
MIPIVLQTDDGWVQGIIRQIQLLAPMMEKKGEGPDILRIESREGNSVVGKHPVPRLINPAYCVLAAFNGRLGSLRQFGKQSQ